MNEITIWHSRFSYLEANDYLQLSTIAVNSGNTSANMKSGIIHMFETHPSLIVNFPILLTFINRS